MQTVVQLRVLPDASVAPVFVYRDRLDEVCGPEQPWMLIPVDKLADLRGELGFDQIMLDEGDGEDQERRNASTASTRR